MCGICGEYNFANKKLVNKITLDSMMDSIVHRGPDDEGQYLSASIGLGFRRLSIIDISGGHQPMSDINKRIWLVFNGEIYNFKELRQELESLGYIFQTKTDTEVIINGYLEWGEDVVNHLNGMFGFAIWDTKEKKLIIARDPMGIKLIYYSIQDGTLRFGSEIRPIIASFDQKPTLDIEAFYLFLKYRYTPSPLTLFENIKKLAPGSMIVANENSIEIKKWYSFQPTPFDPMPSINEAKEELLHIYQRAVKRQLISDVPLGLLLSGGVDSGLLLDLMNKYGHSWKTFTVGYGTGFKHDELKDAEETARLYGADHTSLEIDQNTFESTLPKIIQCLEEPVAASSIVPMYHICQRAREDVKVVLTGQGPDELFGGYNRHLGVKYGHLWRNIPKALRTAISPLLYQLPRCESLKRALYSLGTEDKIQRYQDIFSIMPNDTIEGLFQKTIGDNCISDNVREYWQDIYNAITKTDELNGFHYIEIQSSLPDELLMYGDKLSMAHSLEARVPYLDLEIVEYATRLSSSYKVRHFSRKWLHKKVCNDYLPKKITNRPKRGFAVNVVDDWFRSSFSGEINTMLQDRDSHLYNYLDFNNVTKLVNEHTSGKQDNHKILFSLIASEQWLRSFIA